MPAAGRGKRLGGAIPKQFLTVAGRPLIAWALQPFFDDPRCAGVMLAVAPDDTDWLSFRASLPRPVLETSGGAERADSVRLALQALLARGAQAADWVLVHDAARPCVSNAEIKALVDVVVAHAEADLRAGGLLAVPLADTLKRGRSHSEATVPREGLWRALTPQMFRLGALLQALQQAESEGRKPTDEAQAMEWQGSEPLLVGGESTNIKVTTFADLRLVEGILQARSKGESP
ncbi:MAG: 2-C-methyl-D-erythritol 4-phosphate cytidylyltransferase [Acidibacter sp.]|nr:2-C-methyl-D-erythritol 4-phosphate cytidylyltransferase [Acidibacter sp.]